ncbi:hypothetical protein R3P38DRAFT_3243353 [Favolaschia claudopus]|uniref:Uncharacterized protein n=1 Tax=Favolaschia claudopus TaxID=2862362 RepID=A0AAV9Z362_9AGAR
MQATQVPSFLPMSAERGAILPAMLLSCGVVCAHRPPYSPPSGWRKLLEYWLPRAANHMLYLDLVGRSDDPTQTALLFSTVAPYSLTWRVLECFLQPAILSHIDTVRGRMPLLRELRVWWKSGASEPSAEDGPFTAFSDAPQLRRVSKFYTILQNLEELSIDLQTSPGMAQPMPVVLDHVHDLLLRDQFGRSIGFLSYIALPGLQTLNIGSEWFYEGDRDLLVAFLNRSPCALKVVFMECLYNYEVVVAALAVMDQVAEVILRFVHWKPSDLAQLFARITSDPSFLPNLRALRLPQCETVVPYAEMTEMLASRRFDRENKSRIDLFELACDSGRIDELHNTVDEKFQALMDDGMEIHIIQTPDGLVLK